MTEIEQRSPPPADSGETAREALATLPAAAVLLRGPEHFVEYANPAARAVLGGRDPTAVPLAAAYPSLEAQGLIAILDRVFASGNAFEAPELDVRISRKSGLEEVVSLHAVVSPRRSGSGEVVGLVVFGVDVTAAARARRRAERAEHLLSAIFEVDPGGLAVVAGPDLRFAFANPAYRGMTPYPERDPVGRTLDEVFPISEGFGGRAMWDDLLATRREAVLTTVERAYPDGRRRSFTVHARRLHWSDGEGVLFVAWETTDLEQARRRAEEGERIARRRAAELDAVVESLPSALTIHDAAGVLVRMNAMAGRIWGPIPPELKSAPSHVRLASLGVRGVGGVPLPAGETPVERALAGATVHGFEIDLVRGGESRRMLIHAAPVRLAGGESVGAVAMTEDVSELRELEQQREDLLRTLSHDVRTPLSVVLTQAELIRRHRAAKRPEVERRAEAIVTSVRRITAMVNDLVDMTQLEAGLVKLRPATIDFGTFAADLKDRLRGTMAAERIEVRAAPGGLVHADPDRLERIVVNLLTNAMKFASEGPITLAGEPSELGFVVTVSDRGPGIPPEELPRLFQRFYRSATAGATEGSGLGLYVVRLLAEAHGGTIRAESELGRGSTFRVELPRVSAPAS